jgi:hypothetical protein
MSKIAYIQRRFKPEVLEIIELANTVIREYQAQNFDMTVRQLYYQFIARDLFPDSWIDVEYNRKHGLEDRTKNTDKNYKRLSDVLNNGRMAGLISWTALEDRTRVLHGTIHEVSPGEAIRKIAADYVIDKWDSQDWRVEVWVEKDALIGVISGICNDLDLDFFSSRGFNSQSAMWRAAMRMRRYEAHNQRAVVLHLTDHDPSGIDMTRDLGERFKLFGANVLVKRVALTMEQVEDYNPPPNPAKMTDPRSKRYIPIYGNQSWELDALSPKVLSDLIMNNVFEFRDIDAWEVATKREARERFQLQQVVAQWDQIVEEL